VRPGSRERSRQRNVLRLRPSRPPRNARTTEKVKWLSQDSMQMCRYTSLRSNIVRRHQLPFRLMPLPYRRWGRRWGRGLNKFAHAVALKVHIAAGFVTSKVAALATFGCRGRRRVAYSSDATIHDPLPGLILGLPSAVPHVFERHSAAMSTAAVGSGVPLARNSLMERK